MIRRGMRRWGAGRPGTGRAFGADAAGFGLNLAGLVAQQPGLLRRGPDLRLQWVRVSPNWRNRPGRVAVYRVSN